MKPALIVNGICLICLSASAQYVLPDSLTNSPFWLQIIQAQSANLATKSDATNAAMVTTNTFSVTAALGYTPATNSFAGLTNALGFPPATNGTLPTIWSATTGNVLIPAGTTIYIPLNNSSTNCLLWTTDASGGTRSLMTRTVTFKNAYCVSSVNPGTSKCTITLMTNGVAGSIVLGPSGGTTSSDVSHSDKIVAGVEVGWRIVIASAGTSAKYMLAIESQQ